MRYVRILALGLLAVALASLGTAIDLRPSGSAADPAKTGYPNSMAALGDSITRAANSDALGDQPQNSWSTGTNSTVQSIYLRILAQSSAISGNNHNDAVSGAKMVDLNGQAAVAVSQGVDLVTILMGANDVCTSSEATMTPVATLRSQFEAAMATLSAGLPDARIAAGSIPDVFNLWSILKDNSSARFIWSSFSICQSLLANPLSTAQADIDRRNNVRQRNIDFNAALGEVCAQYIHCHWDNNAVFNLAFVPADVSSLDYFHPSVAGQTLGASVGWGATFDLTDNIAPASTASTTPVGGGASVSLTATDNVGVSGIEYKISSGAYQRYTSPVIVGSSDLMTYRAVDVNGNIEATHCLVGGSALIGDDDCDGVASAVESACGSDPLYASSLPERVDGAFAGADEDGDTQVDEALPPGAEGADCDGDGYTGAAESHVYGPSVQGDQDPCGTGMTLGWPADLSAGGGPFPSVNKISLPDITSFLAPVRYINTNVGTNPGDVRWDLVPGKGIFTLDINIADLTSPLSVAPPMLGGARAINGPACPWPP